MMFSSACITAGLAVWTSCWGYICACWSCQQHLKVLPAVNTYFWKPQQLVSSQLQTHCTRNGRNGVAT